MEQSGREALLERVLERYDRIVIEGRTVRGEDLGALFVMALPAAPAEVDVEPACHEMEERIQRYHLDVCLEHVHSKDDVRPSDRLLARCFKGQVPPEVMLRKLLTPETRRKKGKPVHGQQEVDLGNALFDRVMADSKAEVMMSRECVFPDADTVRKASANAAVPVLAALLRAAGLRHRQIAELLAAMGALKPGSLASQEKQVQRAALDGEARLAGEPPAQRRSLAYTHHPIVEFLLGTDVFVEALAEQPDDVAVALAAWAPDLRAMKVRMALVDFSPTVVNSFQTLDREQWPPVLQRLSDGERKVLGDYGAERLTRTDAELALGRRGVEQGAHAMRPIWRMFVASSLTRMALQDRASSEDVLAKVDECDAGIGADLEGVPEAHRAIADVLADFARAYLELDRVDLALLAGPASVEAAATALEAARGYAAGHPRLDHDLTLRDLTVAVQRRCEAPPSSIARAVEAELLTFVASCSTPELAADNIRQYVGQTLPDVARVLAERTQALHDPTQLPQA